MKKDYFSGVNIIILVVFFIASISYIYSIEGAVEPDPPFSIDVEPNKLSAKGGDEITFSLRIDAEEGFDGSIGLELEVTAMGYDATFDVGTQSPPYPKEFDYTITIPSDIPVDVTANGVLRATSGEMVQEEYVEISIQRSGGGILGWFLRGLSNLWKAILSMFGIK